MADLSPAAQAIKDAAFATYADNVPKDDNLWALECDSIAAALRAAADLLPGPYLSVHMLYTIADELEGLRND